jgi:hypothetical protein
LESLNSNLKLEQKSDCHPGQTGLIVETNGGAETLARPGSATNQADAGKT